MIEFPNIKLETIFVRYLDKIDHPVVAIETGCSYAWDTSVENNLPYLSTLNIVRSLVEPTKGFLYSLDNDPKHIETCQRNLHERGLGGHVGFGFGDSVSILRMMVTEGVNFVWLDSAEDSDHAVAEFQAVQPLLADKYIICVDDFGSKSVKWQAVSKVIMDTFDSYETFDTPTGLIIGLNTRK